MGIRGLTGHLSEAPVDDRVDDHNLDHPLSDAMTYGGPKNTNENGPAPSLEQNTPTPGIGFQPGGPK